MYSLLEIKKVAFKLQLKFSGFLNNKFLLLDSFVYPRLFSKLNNETAFGLKLFMVCRILAIESKPSENEENS